MSNAFEYNRENLVDVWNRTIDQREGLARLAEFVRSMGMAGTEVAGALEDVLVDDLLVQVRARGPGEDGAVGRRHGHGGGRVLTPGEEHADRHEDDGRGHDDIVQVLRGRQMLGCSRSQ